MVRIVVTQVGVDIGLGAIDSLKKEGHYLIAATVNRDSAGLYKSNESYLIPPPHHDDWADEIKNVIERSEADAFIPLGDHELEQLPRLRELIPDTPIVAPTQEAIDIGINKYKTYTEFRDTDVMVPETYRLSEVKLDELLLDKVVVKPLDAGGGYGVDICETQAEIEAYAHESSRPPEEIILQEHIDGDEYTTNVSVLQDGTIVSSVTKQALQNHDHGHMAIGVTCDPQHVRESSREVARHLDSPGPINVQHIVSDGVPYMTEINPRFSGSSCFNAEAGVNEHDLLVRDFIGEEVDNSVEFEKGLCMIRYLDQVYLSKEELHDVPEWDNVDLENWQDNYYLKRPR